MKRDELEIFAARQTFGPKLDLLIRQGEAVATNLVLTNQEPGTIAEPTCSISYEAAQQLIDSLWQCGLRPSEGTGSAGSLRATESHLKDMRKIALHSLGLE